MYKQDGGWIKICETFSDNSLKEDLSIDTNFDPCYFLWDSPFKGTVTWEFVVAILACMVRSGREKEPPLVFVIFC